MGSRTLAGDADVGASGSVLIDLGAPNPGYVWKVKRVIVSAADPFNGALAGTARLFVGALPSGATRPSGADMVDTTDLIPNVGPWEDNELIVLGGQHLYGTVDGATPGQVAMFTAGVIEVRV